VKRELKRDLRLAAILLAPLVGAGCSWLSDFREQPAVKPWQTFSLDPNDTTTPFRANPQGSVPVTGTAVAAYEVSYTRSPITIDSMSRLANPEPPTQASVDRGWKYYQINCAVCHGVAGLGNGPAVTGAPNLQIPAILARSDGYIFGQMRNGGALMPSFNRIDERDRWHVVNYVRGLQGRLSPDIVVRKEAVARPGVTGDALPGPTRTAPTNSVPFVKPTYTPSPTTGATPPAAHGGHE
jgi:mono/diheme cytochrome c family protein